MNYHCATRCDSIIAYWYNNLIIHCKNEWRSKNLPWREDFTPSKRSAGAPPVWSARENFALCGARLKELFEKSSLRNFKNFQHAIVVKLLEMVEKRKMSFWDFFRGQKWLWKSLRVLPRFSTTIKSRKIAKNLKKPPNNAIFGQSQGFPQFPQSLLL